METLAKLTKKADKISEHVNKPRKGTSGRNEPVESLEASRHAPLPMAKSYARASNISPKIIQRLGHQSPRTPKSPTLSCASHKVQTPQLGKP